MAGRAANFGNAVIKLSLLSTDVEKGLKRLEVVGRKTGEALKKIGAPLMGLGGAISLPFVAGIKAASELQETTSKFNAVFGSLAGEANTAASAMAESIGRSTTEVKKGLAMFQAYAVGSGMSGAAALDFSTKVQKAALDMASFHNTSDEEMGGRFLAALSGSSEVLDQFGVNIRQSALEQIALTQGINKSWNEMTELEKTTLRLDAIMQAMTAQGVMGDAVTTAGSFSNQMKRLKGEIQTAFETIGTSVLPTATDFLKKVIGIVDALGKWMAMNTELVAAIGGAGAALLAAGTAAVGLGTALTAITAHPIIAALAATAALGLVVKNHFDDAAKSIEGVKDALNGLEGVARADAAIVKKQADLAAAESSLTKDINERGLGSQGFAHGVTADELAERRAQIAQMKKDLEDLRDLRKNGSGAYGELAPQTAGAAPSPMLLPAAAGSPNVAAFGQRFIDGLEGAVQRGAQAGLQGLGDFGAEVRGKLAELEAAAQRVADGGVADRARESMAMFDTRNIAQLTGARDDELQQLRQIAKNTRPRAGGPFGLPAGPA